MKPTVFLSARISKAARELLQEHCNILLNDKKHQLSSDELSEAVKEADGLLCAYNDPLDAHFMETASHLKVVSCFSAGYDNIDVEAATQHSIAVTNTAPAVKDATADMAFGLIIAAARRIVEGDNFVRREKRGQTDPPGQIRGSEVHDSVLGIIGMGHIGQEVAQRAQAFKMPVLYYQRSSLPKEREKELNASHVSLEDLLQKSDFVSIHVPLTEKTHHLISKDELSKMKETAYLVNTSRGPVVDEKALLQALQEKQIAGAALDVFEDESAISPGLTELDNVVLTPHLGGVTLNTLRKMSMLSAQNLIEVLEGRQPESVINPSVLK